MSEQDQIRAIAELDGFNPEPTPKKDSIASGGWGPDHNKPEWNFTHQLPRYLTSRDAIVPVVQKHWRTASTIKGIAWQTEFHRTLPSLECVLFATPLQLCEALLHATNKWKP